jgi:hypothetical protein
MVLAAVGRVADQNAGVHVGRLNATATAGAGVGAPVTALTPLRPAGGTDGDYGDWDAWQTASGLYLQSNNASDSFVLNKQAANGSLTPVTIPGMDFVGSRPATARGSSPIPHGSLPTVPGRHPSRSARRAAFGRKLLSVMRSSNPF